MLQLPSMQAVSERVETEKERKVKVKNKKRVKISRATPEVSSSKQYKIETNKLCNEDEKCEKNPKSPATIPSTTLAQPHTLPRPTKKIEALSAKPTSLPRPPKPPRKPTGYVSPAASLRRNSKIDMFKGLTFKKLENLPEMLKHSVQNYS